MRLRQICLVAPELEPAVAALTGVLGLAVCYRDDAVAKYGLVNAVIPIGSCFLEVVAPTRPDTAAGRYLARRGGAGGYMVIIDTPDLAAVEQRVTSLGVRVANPISHGDEYRGLQLHPRDTGGALLELNWTRGGESLAGPYHPAGPNWQRHVSADGATALHGAELQSDDPTTLAVRWSGILDRPVTRDELGVPVIALDLGTLRFVHSTDGRGEGLGGIDVIVRDPATVRAAATARGHAPGADGVTLCGTRVRLVAESSVT
jgi:glyoxalase-like protein